jgi:hypothetical protein
MADITMCDGTDCPIKDQCDRFTSKPNEHRQSYFVNVPGKHYDGKFSCEMFWGMPQERIMNQLKDIVNGQSN